MGETMPSRAGFILLAGCVLLFLTSLRATAPAGATLAFQEGFDFSGARIYLADAHGEASRFDSSESGLSHFAALLDGAGAELTTIDWREPVPAEADLVIIASPTRNYSLDQTARLAGYLNQGGRVLMLINPPVGNLSGWSVTNGFFLLTASDFGFQVSDDVVVREISSQIRGKIQAAQTPQPAQLPHPNLLEVDFTSTSLDTVHPITAGLQDELAFFTARSLRIAATGDPEIDAVPPTPLIFTDTDFYGETDYAAYVNSDLAVYDPNLDTVRGSLSLALAYQSPSDGSRVVLIGDREFATNGGGLRTSPAYSASFVFPGNARFLLRAVAWLLDRDMGEVSFATPAPTATITITPSPTATWTPTSTPTLTPTLPQCVVPTLESEFQCTR
jgi:hypothetical protein